MDKDIRQYLHYYLGQDCEITAPDGIPYEGTETINLYWIERVGRHGGKIKPILRKLESMTDEEMKELYCDADCWAHCSKADITKIGFDGENTNCIRLEYKKKLPNFTSGSHIGSERFYLNSISSQKFHWLISHGFDVFNLINRGAAINKEQQ